MGVVSFGIALVYGCLHFLSRPKPGSSGGNRGRHDEKPLGKGEVIGIEHRALDPLWYDSKFGSSPYNTGSLPFHCVGSQRIKSHVGVLSGVALRTAAGAVCDARHGGRTTPRIPTNAALVDCHYSLPVRDRQ